MSSANRLIDIGRPVSGVWPWPWSSTPITRRPCGEPGEHVVEAPPERGDASVQGDERGTVGVPVLLVPERQAVDVSGGHARYDTRAGPNSSAADATYFGLTVIVTSEVLDRPAALVTVSRSVTVVALFGRVTAVRADLLSAIVAGRPPICVQL